MTLWTADEAAAATGGRASGDWAAEGVSIDTRTLEPGDLFVALKAARDGHEFVAQALDKGAAAAMVSHVPDGVDKDAPLLLVEDVQTALEALGKAARARSPARVVAVTGSVGKTSTKEMLVRMLDYQGRTHASVASYNNHWGVPLTLARMPRDTEYAVIEIGMNHPGEIAPLARMARPHVALVTTVAAVHLEAFDTVEDIAREKASVFEGLPQGGVAIINADIPQADILREAAANAGATVITFGTTAQDFRLAEVEVEGQVTRAKADIYGTGLGFHLHTAGAHFAMNALGAVAASAALGADLIEAIIGLRDWVPYRGRGVRTRIPLDTGGMLELIDDSYNANPASVAAALDVLAAASGTRRVAILGDMKELGPTAEALHAELAGRDSMERVDTVHCTGPLARALHDALPGDKRGLWAQTSAELADEIVPTLRAGDVVLVKGSLSMDMACIVDAIREMGHGAGSNQ